MWNLRSLMTRMGPPELLGAQDAVQKVRILSILNMLLCICVIQVSMEKAYL